MQQIWPIFVYSLTQFFEWAFGRGRRKGIDWFARVGLDFCCMGVTLFGILIYNVIEKTPIGDKFNMTINNLGLKIGWVIPITMIFIIVLWLIAFMTDKKQAKIKYKNITTGWTHKKKRLWRGVCGGVINAIGCLLFFIPLKYLF